MGQVKEINIENRSYCFFDDIVDIKNVHSDLLKIDNIYYISYITIKKFDDCENIHSVNPFYIIIHSATGHLKEKNGEKYLVLDSTDKYEEVLSRIRSEIKTLNGGKELFNEKNYARIGIINIDDDLPLNKPLEFLTLTIIIRCVLQEGEKLYPEIYLDECLYELRVKKTLVASDV